MLTEFDKLLSELSDTDRQKFDALLNKLKALKGDFSQLSKTELDLIKSMEAKYGDATKSPVNQEDKETALSKSESVDLLETPFAGFVKQAIARDLANQFPLEAEAVGFAFANKWLPFDCQDLELAEALFERYEEDIREINQWRAELVAVEQDKKMAVGLAWFAIVFLLNKRLN